MSLEGIYLTYFIDKDFIKILMKLFLGQENIFII
jgi:hypothetical protein